MRGRARLKAAPQIPPGRPSLSTIDLQGHGGVVYVLELVLLRIKTTLDS